MNQDFQAFISEQFASLNDKFSDVTGKLDEANSKLDETTAKLDRTTAKLDKTTARLDAAMIKIDEQKVVIDTLNTKIEVLESEVSRLTEENIELRNRVTTIEDRLTLLDEQLTGIAPMVRDLLQEEMSLLLDPEYFAELRDQESISSFRTAKVIVRTNASDSDWEQYLTHFKNDKAIASSFGKSLKQFYQTVTSHAPRHENVYRYWIEAEEIIVNNALRLFKGMFA